MQDDTRNEQNQATAPDSFETTIEKVVTGGAGLGRCGEVAAFVPLTAPGDRVRARVVRRKKNFVQAERQEVLEAGPARIEPRCPHFGDCGGCDMQHMSAEKQLEAKTDIVADCLRRIGGIDPEGLLEAPEPAGPEFGARNRIRLSRSPMGPFGLLRRGSNEVVPLSTCPMMPEVFDKEILPFLVEMPPVDQIVVRLDGRGGYLLSLFGPPNRMRPLKSSLRKLPDGESPRPGCVGILYNNLPLWGRDHLLVRMAGLTWRVGANSFFQGNLAEAEAALLLAREWLGEIAGDHPVPVADLYCGVGLFTLGLADMSNRIIACESDPHAVRDARNNIERDRTTRGKATVWHGRVERVLAKWPASAPDDAADFPWSEAVAVLDPPRTGLGAETAKLLAGLGPKAVLYMSCDPATLARDCKVLGEAGYALKKARVLDMFPQTGHVEVLGVLVKD